MCTTKSSQSRYMKRILFTQQYYAKVIRPDFRKTVEKWSTGKGRAKGNLAYYIPNFETAESINMRPCNVSNPFTNPHFSSWCEGHLSKVLPARQQIKR